MNQFCRLPASEVARLLRTRKVSAGETGRSARTFDSVNPRINAIVHCRPGSGKREQADRVEDPRNRPTFEISLTVPSRHSTLRSMLI
jgi:hypothetical protein